MPRAARLTPWLPTGDVVRMNSGGSVLPSKLGPEPRNLADLLKRLRQLAPRALARMYRPEERLFVFRVRRTQRELVAEGLSRRYTAIALIGLAGEGDTIAPSVLGGHTLHDVCGRLMRDIWCVDNLGDVSLILWAAEAVGYPDRRRVWKRLRELRPAEGRYPVAELAWALIALCVDREAPLVDLRESVMRRLIASFESRSGMFPHVVGGNGAGLRSHVSCFADLVYPIHALTHYFTLAGDHQARDVALRCARQICGQQGPAGQWWWHYDRRTGGVVEHYPVYAVHQDAMAPMALCALQDATGVDFAREVGLGLAWLAQAPELGGGSLIDQDTGVIWRKVARHEPRKLARYLQAVVSRIHSNFRVPGLDVVLPTGAVDYEERPYHLGWLLYAWPASRVERWEEARWAG